MRDRKKHMLHLTPLAEIGGCEVNCLRIIQGADAYEHRVVVFGARGPMSPMWEAAGAPVEHLDSWKSFATFSAAIENWRRNHAEPDAVIYWSTSRLPLILKAFHEWSAPWAVYLGNPLGRGMLPGIRRVFSESIRRRHPGVTLVACSQKVAASHRRASYFRQFAMEVIYNAVDPELDRPRTYREIGEGETLKLGMVARLDKIKDHRTVIRALAVGTSGKMSVEFAGSGPLHEELRLEAVRLDVSDRVRFLGSRTVAPLLAEWDIYVHSTTEAEGMGTALAEAMMAGLPCIVSDIPVMREVCGDDCAIYVSPGDPVALAGAMARLSGDRRLREALGHASRLRARRMFGLQIIASAYSKVVSSSLVSYLP
jgi:glycosyltransferase involved in cell wall biosynthesis